MFEWALIFNGIERAFIILATVAGWLIQRNLQRREESDKKIELKLDAIYRQVHATNGRVGRLEEWRENHEKNVDSTHENFRDAFKEVWSRVNKLVDKEK